MIASASLVPTKVGVLMLVIPSELELPESLAIDRAGAAGVLGTVVSIVTFNLLDAALTLPAASVTFTVSSWRPSLSEELVMDQLPEPLVVALPRLVVPLVSYKTTELPSSAVPLNPGVLFSVMLSVLERPESLPAFRSGVLAVGPV